MAIRKFVPLMELMAKFDFLNQVIEIQQ
jgi:hypothetical protein